MNLIQFLNFTGRLIARPYTAAFVVVTATALLAASFFVNPSFAAALDAPYFQQDGNAFDALGTLGTTDSNGLRFITNGTERARFDTTGNFAIGTTTSAAKLSVTGDGFAGGINFQTTNASGTPLFTILDNGNIGIGSSTPGSKLTLSGGNFTQTISSDPTLMALITDTRLDGAADVQVVGTYAYTVGGNDFAVIDISKPSDPVIVGSIHDTTNINTNDTASLRLAGHYAYVGSKNRFTIIDIADPSNPRVVSSLTSALFSSIDPLSVYISGKYAYIASGRGTGAHALISVDISDPLAPYIVDSEDFGALGAPTNLNNGFVNQLYVQGRYAYLAIGLDVTEKLQIYDVSDPTHLRLISQESLPTSVDIVTDILADGKYVYIGGDFNTLWVVDVSDPTDPVVETYGGSCGRSLYKSGNYLYAVAYFGTPGICVYDVSDPTIAPVQVGFTPSPLGSTQITHGHTSLIVSGHHAYTVSNMQDSFLIYDVTGTLLPTADIGNLNIGNGFVTGNFDIYNSANIQGGLNVGVGGFYTEGAIASAATSSPSYFGGSLGIGTTSPSAKLSVTGTAGTTTPIFTVASSTNASYFSVTASGAISFGGQTGISGQILQSLGAGAPPQWVSTSSLGLLSSTGSTSLPNALADGSTKGVAAFAAADFDSFSPGLISIDYASGQAASSSAKGFLTAADWSAFNGKQAAITGTTGQVPYFSGTNTLMATSSLYISPAGNVGVGTTSPWGKLSVTQEGTAGNPAFIVEDSASDATPFLITQTGQVGIGMTNPSYTLDVAGYTNVNNASGYKQGGNTVLFASTTNSTLAVGASSAAAWMQATTTSFISTAVGQGALAATPTSALAVGNTAVGFFALNANTTGFNNTAIGRATLSANTSGSNNVALGSTVLSSNISGNQNMGVGGITLFANTTGSDNVAIGVSALRSSVTGSGNVAIGTEATRYNLAATSTTAIGYRAGYGNAVNHTAGNNTFIGYQSGFTIGNAGNSNTGLGYQSLYNLTTGSFNMDLGAFTTTGGPTTGSGNIRIGQDVRSGFTGTASNQLNIGNLIYGTNLGSGATLSTGGIGIGTTTPGTTLDVNGFITTESVKNCGMTTQSALGTDSTGKIQCIDIIALSDGRLKSDITTLEGSEGLDLIIALRPVSYHWKNPAVYGGTDVLQYGFIAQEAGAVAPNLVGTTTKTALTPGGSRYVNYIGLIAPLVKAVQELNERITELARGVFNSITAQRVHTQLLCVGDTCVTEAEFLQMVKRSSAGSYVPAPSQEVPAVPPDASDEPVESIETVEPEPEAPQAPEPAPSGSEAT